MSKKNYAVRKASKLAPGKVRSSLQSKSGSISCEIEALEALLSHDRSGSIYVKDLKEILSFYRRSLRRLRDRINAASTDRSEYRLVREEMKDLDAGVANFQHSYRLLIQSSRLDTQADQLVKALSNLEWVDISALKNLEKDAETLTVVANGLLENMAHGTSGSILSSQRQLSQEVSRVASLLSVWSSK